ncbi:MAG TPA: uroporphyrinogen-III synthase [Dongiaceae bacterium]|nr:uroporphyrinogen-III synthase [Dongiaceae bacterium]
MPLTALITRPEEDARPLAEALASRGVVVVIEPLLAIRVLPEAAGDLAKDLAGVQALLFTSANGARAFAELSPRREIGVLAVGDATATAARELGFGVVESAGGDVQALARLAKQRLKPAGGPLFHAAGSAVAGDLAGTLAAEGFELRRRMLYESTTATSLSPETVAALRRGRVDLVLLFSPRTAATFTELAKAAAIETAPLTALCLSPAVAKAVEDLPWRRVEVAEKPDLPSLLALVDRVAAADPPTAIPAAETKAAPLGAPPPELVPATPLPTLVPAPRRSAASVFLAGLIGAVIAAAAVVALMRFAPEKIGLAPAGTPAPAATPDLAPRIADLAARLDAQQKAIDSLPKSAPDLGDLPAKVAALQQKVAALPAPGATPPAAIPAEIKALPQQMAALDPRLGSLDQRLGALEQKLAALPQGGAAAADLAPLRAELGSLKEALKSDEAALGDLAAVKQEVAKLEAAASGARSAATTAGLVLGVTELRARIAAGEPFAAEVDALSKLAAGDPAMAAALAEPLAALKPLASGPPIPGFAQLRAEFPAMAEAVTHADAAGALPANASFWDRVVGRLESLVTVRPVAEGGQVTGNSNLDRLARAEAKLGSGDLPGAVSELSGLTGPAKDAAASWLARAQARFQTDAAAKRLSAALLAAFAKDGAPQ